MKHIFLIACIIGMANTVFAQAYGNEGYSKSAGNAPRSNINVYNNAALNTPPAVANPTSNTIIMDIKCLYNAKADAYTAIFNVVQTGKDAKEADDLMTTRLTAFMNAAISAGLVRDDIFIDMVSFIPLFEMKEGEPRLFSKTYQEVPNGFELQKNIHLRFSKGEMLDKIVSIATQNEIYDLVKVDYFVNDSEKIYDTMRSRAIEQVKKRAAEYAKIGVRVDTMYHILAEASNSIYPVERYQQYQAFSGQSLDAAKKKNAADIKTVRKPLSIYYNKLPYNNFDIVINPTIIEPVVQYTYNLQVRYTTIYTAPSQKTLKQFYIISPNGDTKLFDVR